MKSRIAALALAAAVSLGLAGCNLAAPQDTTIQYDPSDGVSLALGDLELRNVLVISEDGELGNLVGTAVNTTGSDIDFTVQWKAGGEFIEIELTAESNGRTDFGFEGGQVTLEPLGAKPGALLEAVVHISSDQKELRIPVLDGTLEEYKPVLPKPTPKPTPSATPEESEDSEG